MAVTTQFYETFFQYIGGSAAGVEQINLSKDTFHLLLLSSAYTFDNEHSVRAQVSANQISTPNYTVGGIALTNVTYTIAASGTGTFDADDVIVTASGADMSAAYGVVCRVGSTNPLMEFINFGGVQTAGTGTTFQVTWNADGIVEVKEG